MRSTSRNRYIQDTKTVFPNLILVRGTLLRFVDIWQHPQDGQIGTKDKGILLHGGIPSTSSRHPGWELLH